MQIKTIVASTLANLDSNVYTGGGTDLTELLQKALDEAVTSGGVRLVMDGAALIHGLLVHSNTTIECLSGDCGFYLADQSNCAVITNADWDFTEIQNRNITLSGGTYNQNCAHQLHHLPDAIVPHPKAFGTDKWVIELEFYGVENLNIRDITIRNQRTFAMLCANWKNVKIENVLIDLPDRMHGENQDGLHFWGPGQFLCMHHISGQSGDDFIALAPDEHDETSDITDVLIDGVFLDDADQGIRLLSRNKGRLDRVTIRNVTGTYRSFGFYINPWFPGDTYGNFGNLVFENIDLRQTAPNYDYTPPFLFRLGGNIESITFRNICHHHPVDSRSLFDIGQPFLDPDYVNTKGEKPLIRSIVMDGIHIVENSPASAYCEYIRLMCPITHMVVRNVEVIRDKKQEAEGCLIRALEHCELETLVLNHVFVSGMKCFIDAENGGIGTIHAHQVVCENVEKSIIAGPSTVVKS